MGQIKLPAAVRRVLQQTSHRKQFFYMFGMWNCSAGEQKHTPR
jgi:hypothetical protein